MAMQGKEQDLQIMQGVPVTPHHLALLIITVTASVSTTSLQ
jgi:hypothetical protein